MKASKLAYKPVGLLLGVAAGAVAGAAFERLWRAVSGSDDAPDATDEDRGWGEIVAAAAMQGALFAVTRAVVSRGGAQVVRRLTGSWPA